MKNRVTQKHLIFYLLYKNYKEGNEKWIPVWSFMGEHYIKEVSKWGFMSHEVSARTSELYSENIGLINRKMVTGKSGARYYAYKLTDNPYKELIKDPKIIDFYFKIKRFETTL